ncbi:PREDICTED: ER degradation-enhancing alpha-mannosidase-like protein 3 [Dufourea novaeangliae]|uniref:alpha-1,2-Mannosidase n=1 Tax=Dufourea novaeangliae TaxID=178035 RepID=A0A154NX49_DUFNO|nr:PREDICTED: ER degradation-enhancing alpha-mannosidase-like protein 3 [Dufourea novaeangliae]KZC04239.1 ER degradation-enhancing alpha-mannosidase-like 3 [Dufourea novaeangliae]
MACGSLIWRLLMFGCSIQVLLAASKDDPLEYMSKEERDSLKEEARDMFYHAYNAYMDNAYPADELMPLSCKGRYRGSEPNRGDIDSTLGNFSLTLVDTLDTLVVLGDLEEFENAVKVVARDVSFDTDVIVSLFETNIRMLGGLLSGHILAEYLQQRADIMPWYRGELLNLAKDLGYRFLPAFNTTTGIPYGRINLKYGMKGVPLEVSRETCTACAGSMILEMAALSRLTGESIFEEKAQKAMDVLWRMRHRGTDLMGSVLNVHSGDWVRRDSGVGAGIDSYYEYCLKAYILLGDEKYLGRFNKHYQAVMKYVSQGPMLLDVHMHRPNTNSKNFMDALLAFWPGLQVLKGDIKPAVETHEMLYQVMQRHNFIPEAFTTDFQVHWGHHPLRPEFLESTYFLYRATGDHYYLGVGRKVLKSLQTYARVPCGYAAVSDVRTNKHDDTMDSFVLSETFKYLFLLFAEPGELVLDLDEFIFTTEGHLLPLTLASVRTNVSSQDFERDMVHVDEMDRTCPNSLHLFPASVRLPLRNMVEDVCPRRAMKRRLSAAQFQANSLEHLKLLSDMGITTLTLADGRVQLLHTFSNAKTPQDSEEGLLFMQEMVEISKLQSQQVETKPQAVTFVNPNTNPPQKIMLFAGPAHFGPELQGSHKITGKVISTYPPAACTDLLNVEKLAGKIAIMNRGSCMFIEKARRIQQAGAIAGIVLDNVEGSNAATSPMFAMSGDGKEVDDVTIPVVFLFSVEASELLKAIAAANGDLTVTLGTFYPNEDVQLKAPTDLSMFERLKGSLKSFLTQQITPQTPGSSGLNLEMISKLKHEEDEKDIVYSSDLRAEIVNDWLGGEVKITSSYKHTRLAKSSDDSTTLVEKQWRQLREVFANQIYTDGNQNAGLQIRSFILESYCNWILQARGGTDVLLNMSLKSKVFWFLEELAQVAPNSSIIKMDQLMKSNRQKILKQYLLAKMERMVLHMNSLRPTLVWTKYGLPNSEQLLQLTQLSIAQDGDYKFLRQLLPGIFDTEDESTNKRLFVIDHFSREMHKEYLEMLTNIQEKYLEKSIMEHKNSYHDVVINNWQRDLKNFEKLDILKKIIEHDATIEEFIADSTESSKMETKFKDVAKISKKHEAIEVEKLEDLKYFIIAEIEKADKISEQNNIRKYKDHVKKYKKHIDVSKDAADNTGKEVINPNNVVLNASLQSQSDTEELEERRKYMELLEHFTKITNSLENIQSNNLDFLESVINNNSAEKQVYEESSLNNGADFQLIGTQITASNVKTIVKDREDMTLEKVEDESTRVHDNQKNKIDIEHSVNFNANDNKIMSSNLPTELNDNVRTTEEEKNKHSVHNKQESLSSSHVQEYGSKHIDDEL